MGGLKGKPTGTANQNAYLRPPDMGVSESLDFHSGSRGTGPVDKEDAVRPFVIQS